MRLKESNIPRNKLLRSLKQRDRWVCFNEKKKPVGVDSNNPVDVLKSREHHRSYTEAKIRWANNDHIAGVGFAIGLDDELVLIDLDDCLNDQLYITDDAYEDIFKTINSYTEVSFSGNGLHILASGYNLKDKYGHSQEHSGIEIYDGQKFFTFTGRHVVGPKDVQNQRREIATLHRRYGPWMPYREWKQQQG
jgi:primase-polymerase (primpol)-like protein